MEFLMNNSVEITILTVLTVGACWLLVYAHKQGSKLQSATTGQIENMQSKETEMKKVA